jgi:hypothetical protein
MEHNRAVKTQAVERYLLGEMPADERDDFEEHYFACAECAQDVRAGARFRANARELLRDPEQFSPPARERRGFSWWSFPSMAPVAVSVLLLSVVVYQAGFVIPGLKREAGPQGPAQGAVAFSLHDTTRGSEGAKVTRIPRGAGLVSLNFDIVTDEKQPSYECTIADASGKTMAVTTLESPKGDESLSIQLHREYFPPGRYRIEVRGASNSGGPGKTLLQYEFEII